MQEYHQEVLAQHRHQELLNFLTITCRIDPTRRCLRSNLHQCYNNHRSWNGSYPDLLTGRDEFTRIMEPMCELLGLQYKRFAEGWCYVGITTGDDNLVIRPQLTEDGRKTRDLAQKAVYRERQRMELNSRQRCMRNVDKILDRLGLNTKTIEILRSQDLFRIVYRQPNTKIRWSERNVADNIQTHINIEETYRQNVEIIEAIRSDHMVPTEVSKAIQRRLLIDAINASYPRTRPRPRLRIRYDTPVNVTLPDWATTPPSPQRPIPLQENEVTRSPIAIATTKNRISVKSGVLELPLSPGRVRLRMTEIEEETDRLSPESHEYQTLEIEYSRYEDYLREILN